MSGSVHAAASACYDRMAHEHAGDTTSSETPFRHFNNFVKKSLIQCALDNASANGSSQATVLDLASGRGGDIMKWIFLQSPKLSKETTKLRRSSLTKATQYHCFDISPASVEAAQQRYDSLEEAHELHSTFQVANCFERSFLQETLPKHAWFGRFDIVTIQFAFHYACSSAESVKTVLECCLAALAPGGLFIATIVNSEKVVASVNRETGCLNGIKYKISFRPAEIETTATTEGIDGVPFLRLGSQYHFFLEDFVDCDEYFVPIDVLRSIAKEVGFEDDSGKPFDSLLSQYRLDRKALTLAPDEKELVGLYRTVILRKPGGRKAEKDSGFAFRR